MSWLSNIGNDISNLGHSIGHDISSVWHNPVVQTVAPLAASYFLGPEAGAAMGTSAAVGGAAVGAGTSLAMGGGARGAMMGAAGGYFAGGYGSPSGDMTGASGQASAAAQQAAASGDMAQADSLAQQAGFHNYAAMQAASSSGMMSQLGSGMAMYGGMQLLGAARQGQQQMQGYAQASNPLAPYQPGYAAQLAQLMGNPNLITSMPGYQAGLQGTERGMAAGGYAGSGNMLAQLGQYSGNFFNNQVNQLAGMSTQNAYAPGQLMGNYLPQSIMQQMGGYGMMAAPFLSRGY